MFLLDLGAAFGDPGIDIGRASEKCSSVFRFLGCLIKSCALGIKFILLKHYSFYVISSDEFVLV